MIAGPPLERVMRRIAETPSEFLAEPRIGSAGTVHVAALVADLVRAAGFPVDRAALIPFESDRVDQRNRLSLAAVTIWLLADLPAPTVEAMLTLLGETIGDLAATGQARAFVEHAERREELARTALAALGLLPEGEDMRQAADRLSAVSASERQRLIRASRAAEDRARQVREALVRKAAEESADKYTRE
ncbi:hypothetical protein [Sphingomonas endolithica]|uniref:hypothetical protein n=1 Tax=Sphingomonas endolithica TaxID=2972485 RepID=UPI0021AF5EE4|nr:hypothetical protein [Sphingomonas sp. ZFBP2030]